MKGQRYHIFHRTGRKPYKKVAEAVGKTGHDAIAGWLALEREDGRDLKECDLAAVADWAFYTEHYK